MSKSRYISQRTIDMARRTFARAGESDDQTIVNFIETIIVKPVTLALVIGIVIGILMCIAVASETHR